MYNIEQFQKLIDTNKTFDVLEEYYFYVFKTLYKNKLIESVGVEKSCMKYYFYPSFSKNNYLNRFTLEWFSDTSLMQYTLKGVIPSTINHSHKPSEASGYIFIDDQFNAKIDKFLFNLICEQTKFIETNPYNLNTSYIKEVVETLSICLFSNQQNFTNLFFDSKSNQIIEFLASRTVMKLQQIYQICPEKDNIFFSKLFKSKFLKSLSFDTKKLLLDTRSDELLKFSKIILPTQQDILFNTLLNKSSDKEKFVLHSLFRQPNFPDNQKDKYSTILKNFSAQNNTSSLGDISELMTIENVPIYSYSSVVSIPTQNVYDFYKSIYIKKNFPLKKNQQLQISTIFSDINFKFIISINTEENLFNLTLNISYKRDDEKTAKAFISSFKHVEFFDLIVVDSHRYSLEFNLSDFFSNQELLNLKLESLLRNISKSKLENLLSTDNFKHIKNKI